MAAGRTATLAAGLATIGAVAAEGEAAAGTTAGGATGRGDGAADALTVTCGCTGGWFAGGGITGLGTVTGAMAAGATAGACGAGVFGAAGATGVAAAGGRTGGATAGGACCLRIAFSTSPGREIFERSILVLISSLSTRLERLALAAAAASPPAERK